jgi:hypothetical protein
LFVEVYCVGEACGGAEAGLAVFAGVAAEERILWALCDVGEVQEYEAVDAAVAGVVVG